MVEKKSKELEILGNVTKSHILEVSGESNDNKLVRIQETIYLRMAFPKFAVLEKLETSTIVGIPETMSTSHDLI